MTIEQMKLTEKYMNEYSNYCSNRECGPGCPVFDEHQIDKKNSCFMIYCRLRETGVIK